MAKVAAGPVQVEVLPADGEDLADAGPGGQQKADDVGEVAGVVRTEFAGYRFLPAPDRGPDGLEAVSFEGHDGPAAAGQAGDVADRVGADGAVPYGHGVADPNRRGSLPPAVPAVEGCFGLADPGGDLVDGQQRVPQTRWPGPRCRCAVSAPPELVVAGHHRGPACDCGVA